MAIDALDLIGQHGTGDIQAHGQNDLEGVPLDRVGDWADDGELCEPMVFPRREHQCRPPPSLLMAGVGRKVNPDQITATWRGH
jgi:hypothetical protein